MGLDVEDGLCFAVVDSRLLAELELEELALMVLLEFVGRCTVRGSAREGALIGREDEVSLVTCLELRNLS